jgi:phosphopantothenoylcysteine decarboxylase/phosphopantothenate--cysteine ligase
MEYGTGLLRTTIAPDRGGYRWTRRPGPLAPTPFACEADGAALAELSAIGGARLVRGVGGAEERSYHVDGSESVAGLLLRDGPDARLARRLRDVGRLLRAVHELPGPPTPAPARGVRRLEDWLSGRAGTPRAAYAASLLARGLGPRLAPLRDWCVRLRTDAVTLSHGCAGLGSVVAGSGEWRTELLAGEDICSAPWYLDLGWLVGELVELRWQLPGNDDVWRQSMDALFDGYGRDPGEDWAPLAALRILLHIHDFTAYVGWNDESFSRHLHFVTFLLDRGPEQAIARPG